MTKRRKAVLSGGLHPQYRGVVETVRGEIDMLAHGPPSLRTPPNIGGSMMKSSTRLYANPRTLDDLDASAINTNYAISAGLHPGEDAIAQESAKSPYVNLIEING